MYGSKLVLPVSDLRLCSAISRPRKLRREDSVVGCHSIENDSVPPSLPLFFLRASSVRYVSFRETVNSHMKSSSVSVSKS